MLCQLSDQAEQNEGGSPLANKERILVAATALEQHGEQDRTTGSPKERVGRELRGLVLDHAANVMRATLWKSCDHIDYYDGTVNLSLQPVVRSPRAGAGQGGRRVSDSLADAVS
jgi:hypothetical protein